MSAPGLPAASWHRFPSVGLAELDAAAALTHRVDTKYVVPVAVLGSVLDQLRATHACLAVEGRRSFRYSSSYVDSPELTCYHDHRRGVRKRWKARIRRYEDSGRARWEVKLKDGRGLTVKHALPLPDGTGTASTGTRLSPELQAFLAEVLRRDYHVAPPPELATTLAVRYRRSTLTQRGEENRVTVDSELQLTSSRGEAWLRPDLALVETKSPTGRSAADQVLAAAGLRPCSVSKYCVGIALLDPTLPNHPWRQLLGRHFLSTTRAGTPTGQELAA